MEAYLAAEYKLTLDEVMALSWRRLRVLLGRGFKIEDRALVEEQAEESGFDWSIMDQAIGRETPQQVHRMSVSDFMRMTR